MTMKVCPITLHVLIPKPLSFVTFATVSLRTISARNLMDWTHLMHRQLTLKMNGVWKIAQHIKSLGNPGTQSPKRSSSEPQKKCSQGCGLCTCTSQELSLSILFAIHTTRRPLVQRRSVADAFQNTKFKEPQSQAAPRTMGALFAQMKAQRMRTVPQQSAAGKSCPWASFQPAAATCSAAASSRGEAEDLVAICWQPMN